MSRKVSFVSFHIHWKIVQAAKKVIEETWSLKMSF